MKKIKVLDFDPGCGGFTKGLEDSKKFEVIYNGLINEDNIKTYNYTHTNDFSELDVMPKEFDLMVCTPHLGNKNSKIKSANFTEKYINNLIALIMINNIDNIIFITNREAIPFLHTNDKVFLTKDNFPTRDIISCKLIKLNYNVFNFILDGAGFGLPQHKYYNIYWASKKVEESIKIKEGFGFYKRPYRTPYHLLKDIKDDTNLSWHTPDYRNKDIIVKNNNHMQIDKVISSLSPDFYNISSKPCSIHPIYNRPLTIREGARLFGLTDDFDWKRSLKKNRVAMMIYNSFPPFISKLMANKIYKLLKKL